MKGQKTTDRLGEDNYNLNNKGSKQVRRKKYAYDINRQPTKEKNANTSYITSRIIRETIIKAQVSTIIFVKT